MVFVVKYFRRNQFQKKVIFLKIFFGIWFARKKLRKGKMQLSLESGNRDRPLPNFGEHVWPDLAKMAGFQQDSSGSCQIRPDSGHFGQIRLDQWLGISGRIPALLARSGRIPAILARSGRIPAILAYWPDLVRSGWIPLGF
jgi:hypothetical protein